ncbi:MAG TPA: hypothetical protein VGA53_02450 [Candidatus Paceibacterota bacterium]
MKTILFLTLAVSLVAAQPVEAQTGTFELQQNIRNLTRQNFVWANTAAAQAGDRLELQIVVRWTGAAPTDNVLVRETLDQRLTHEGNLKVDGVETASNITAENVNIGALQANQTKTITFEATVNGPEAFPAGTTTIVNSSTVFNTQSANSGVSRVQVGRDAVPTDVSTGPLTMWMIGGFLVTLAAGIAGTIFYLKYYVRTRVLESEFDTRVDRKLANAIGNIRQKEKKG